MLDFYDAWSFETTRVNNHSVTVPSALTFWVVKLYSSLKLPKTNYVATEPSAQILLGSDSLKCQHKNRTHRLGQKLPPPGKYYLCFQLGGEIAHAAQCSKSRTLTKVIDLVLDIE